MNLSYQNGSLSKGVILVFNMYLKPCVWNSRRGIIGLSDKNEMCTLYYQNSTYNEIVYIPLAAPSFLLQYFVLIKIL